MLHRGRLADNRRARAELLGFAPTKTTSNVIDELYQWPSVVHLPARWRRHERRNLDGPAITQRIADIITFPARTVTSVSGSAASSMVGPVRHWIADEVDDWGRDDGFTNRVWSASRARSGHLGRRCRAAATSQRCARHRQCATLVRARPAVCGARNRRSDRSTRPIRWSTRQCTPGSDDAAHRSAAAHRGRILKGRSGVGELIVLGAAHQATNQQCGVIDHRLVGAAIVAKVPVFPTASASVPLRRSARVSELARFAKSAKRRRGPLEELELADIVRERIDELLAEMGGTLTGTPLDWLPFGGFGAL